MAEQAEYGVHPAYSVPQVGEIERRAVLLADARIAVTAGLVAYWRRAYGYKSDRHVIIPTTLSSSWTSTGPDPAARAAIRSRLGIADDEVVLLYAGSNSPWQGIDLLLDEAERGLARSSRVKFLFLTDPTPRMNQIMHENDGRFIQQRVRPTEVRDWMQAADYGMLIRPSTETNEVAFPTKYAEYLSAGLKVISNGPPAVLKHLALTGSGLRVHSQLPWEALRTGTPDDRQKSYAVAVRDFSKSSYRSEYANLTSLLL
jgi:glycosyltransferase involved in cell wall biosynthesis